MLSRFVLAGFLATLANGFFAPAAQAGPLLDWLFGGRQSAPAYPVGPPIPLGNGGYTAGYAPGYAAPGYAAGYAPWGYNAPAYNTLGNGPSPLGSRLGFAATGYSGVDYSVPGYTAPTATPSYAAPSHSGTYGTYYGSSLPAVGPNGAGYSALMPSGISAATLPSGAIPQVQQPVVPMSYVPNYTSNALRAPVTYYRPLMTTDPNTGAQVVAMAPCTSYQYLTQRVPTFGQTALYGSYQTPTVLPPARTIPGYTLPAGGIPIAQSVPSYGVPPTTMSYSPYTAYQPSLPPVTTVPGAVPSVVPGTQGYSTTPLGSSPYYSMPSGGCTGSAYSGQSVPGLSLPSTTPYSATPNYSAPAYSTPEPGLLNPPASTFTPGTNTPAFPPNNSVLPSTDPADTTPSLPPYSGLRPQLRSITPSVTGSESASSQPSSNGGSNSTNSSRDLPVVSPIPAPEGLKKPRWNPGLLRDTDMTAMRPVTRADDYAGQSKKIVWASFEQSSPQPAAPASMRVAEPQRAPAPAQQPAAKRYDYGGWKASR